MFEDALMLLDPAATAITVTAVSTNVFDAHMTTGLPATLSTGRDLGIDGHVLDIDVIAQQTFTAAGAATLQVSLQGAPDAGGNAPGGYYDMIMTGVLAKANLVTGKHLMKTPLPMKTYAMDGTETAPRFYALKYTVATGPFTAGEVQSMIMPHDGMDSNRQYASGFTVAN